MDDCSRAKYGGTLVEACWTAARQTGPLHAFNLRIRARHGHSVAVVAATRKLAGLILDFHSSSKACASLCAWRQLP